MLSGSISTLGNHYIIDLQALNCTTGDSIAHEQAEADSKEAILKFTRQGNVQPARQTGRVPQRIREIRHAFGGGHYVFAGSFKRCSTWGRCNASQVRRGIHSLLQASHRARPKLCHRLRPISTGLLQH